MKHEGAIAIAARLPGIEHAQSDIVLHLFVQKPLPLDLAKAELIARRVRESGIVTAVGYHWRQWGHVKAVRAALPGDRVGMALGYFLNALAGLAVVAGVECSRSGGQIVEQAIHIVDLARYLVGEVEQVSAMYATRGNLDEPGHDQEDVYTVNLRFRNGAIGNLSTCSVLHHGSTSAWTSSASSGSIGFAKTRPKSTVRVGSSGSNEIATLASPRTSPS